MHKPIHIFNLGRRQGIWPFSYPFGRLENARNHEKDAFLNSPFVKKCTSRHQADLIFVRNKPENTSDADFRRMNTKLLKFRNQTPILNDISAFPIYDAKDRNFESWQNSGFACPEYLVFGNESENDSIKKLRAFLEKHGPTYLRTNNDTGSEGMHLLKRESSDADLHSAYRSLEKRATKQLVKRKDTKIIAVAFIDSADNNGRNHICRAHILGGHVLSYYSLVSRRASFHAKNMEIADYDAFIDLNRELQQKFADEKFRKTIVSASHALGCNLGAIEFFIIDNQTIFLEINPMWGGNHIFGNSEFMARLEADRAKNSKELPALYKWLNPQNFYLSFFEELASIVRSGEL